MNNEEKKKKRREEKRREEKKKKKKNRTDSEIERFREEEKIKSGNPKWENGSAADRIKYKIIGLLLPGNMC